jgi:hypothetical protein
MIKHINHQNVSTTPFVAAKSRALSNIQNADTVILEPSGYPDGTNVSLDYIDYNSGDPIINRECDIALEQQDLDSLGYEEGITGSAKFNPDTDPQNTDGTYKSLVHRTIKNAFYNDYRNPTEIFGIEHIDFPLSKTLRNLSDKFRMFSIPQLVFGDKIKPQSVQFYDNLLDDNVVITDDGYQNLVAGTNLFSKVQEVRFYPSGGNYVITGSVTSSYICPTYTDTKSVSDGDAGYMFVGFCSGSIFDTTVFVFQSQSVQANIAFQYGSLANGVAKTEYPVMNLSFLSGSLLNAIVSSSYPPESASFSMGFLSGSIFDTLIYINGGSDTGSMASIGFLSGSIFDTLIAVSGSNETSSFVMTFLSGSVFTGLVIAPSQYESSGTLQIGFNSGYIT